MSKRDEMTALRKLDSAKFREVSAEMVAVLADHGLCTPMGNITEAGRSAIGPKRNSFARSAHLFQMSMRPSWSGK